MLEPDEWKRSSPVLRRESGSNPADLADYVGLSKIFGGEVIHVSAGSNTHINPMDISMDYNGTGDPLKLKSEFILTFCELLAGDRNGLSAGQRSVIGRACRMVYLPYFRHPSNDTLPTLKNLYETIKAQPEPEAKSLALELELYIDGPLSVFSERTNVNVQNRFVVYDVRELGKQLMTIGMTTILDQIWNRITYNHQRGVRTWVYIDEIQLLFANEFSSRYFFELWSRSRKWGAIPTGITQNVETLLFSEDARRMLSNSEFIIMLNQATSDRVELAKLLDLSNKQLRFVTNAKPGQGLLRAGSAMIPFINDFPKDTKLYKAMTTKFGEKT